MAVPAAAALALQLPDSFKNSYNAFKTYPANLVHRSSYPAALEACPDGGLEKTDVVDEMTLKEWLGDRSSSAPVGMLATKKDPRCRFIFITADSSRKPLKITRAMLVRILSYHQVMTGYLDFLFVFGSQSEARDLRFSGFREQVLLGKPSRAPQIRSLGRSGRQFQLSYNLKAVARKSSPEVGLSEQQWSIRQAAFHHQFDVEEGTALWIVTQGHLTIKDRVQEMTAVHGRPEDRDFGSPDKCFRTSLTTHLLYSHWSTEEWRWYIQWLEEVIDKEVSDSSTRQFDFMILSANRIPQTELAIIGTRGVMVEYAYTPNDIQIVQHREDKVNEAIMVLEANTDVLTSLRNFYQRLMENKDFELKANCQEDVIVFAAQLDDMIYDSRMQIARAKVLVKITADRKSLSQATGKMEELTQYTIKIGTMSQREAIAMRIITVVTLVYLPATFVSTFFSTDIIKYQNQNGGNGNDASGGQYMGSFSEVALFRWLQITMPLTAITLAVGWFAFVRSGKKADKEFEAAQLPFYEEISKPNSRQ
ncbi:MAG: hypothetical protein M1818_002193 [Claussenomyces sp. TS43310]|nr:MAG: hypothetical protein M1818_002193 [Claussenomyces sp. TS43310]